MRRAWTGLNVPRHGVRRGAEAVGFLRAGDLELTDHAEQVRMGPSLTNQRLGQLGKEPEYEKVTTSAGLWTPRGNAQLGATIGVCAECGGGSILELVGVHERV